MSKQQENRELIKEWYLNGNIILSRCPNCVVLSHSILLNQKLTVLRKQIQQDGSIRTFTNQYDGDGIGVIFLKENTIPLQYFREVVYYIYYKQGVYTRIFKRLDNNKILKIYNKSQNQFLRSYKF